MSDAPTNVGKRVKSNIVSAHYQEYTNNSVSWLAQMTLCLMT